MLPTTLHSCYFNPVAQLWCFGFKLFLHYRSVFTTINLALLFLVLIFLINYLINLAQVSTTRPYFAQPRSVLISHAGKCISSENSGHVTIPPNTCCICDRKRKIVFRCRNIADNVCLGCVVQWTIQNQNGSNPWPCCRPTSPTESSA